MAPAGLPAGYGKSCIHCSRAKCKCILRPEGSSCERCFRLSKECVPMTSARQKSNRRATSSRTAQLEEKLEDLVSILKANQAAQPAPTSASPSRPSQPPSSHLQFSSHHPGHSPSLETQPTAYHSNIPELQHHSPSTRSTSDPYSSRLDSLATAATTSTTTNSSYPTKPPYTYDGVNMPRSEIATGARDHTTSMPWSSLLPTDRQPEPTAAEAEEYFQKFKDWIKYFPFLVFSQQTAAQLRQDKPFLWLCIMNNTTLSVPQIVIMKDRVRRDISGKVLSGEFTLDFLQGLIVYLAWAPICAGGQSSDGPPPKPFLVTYMQMAILAYHELGMARDPVHEQMYTVSFKLCGTRRPQPKVRTMEERRAILALWFISSTITPFAGKMEPLDWTDHMEECLNQLTDSPEAPGDETLCALIRLQQIKVEAQKLHIRDAIGDSGRCPPYMFKKALIRRFQDVRNRLSRQIMENPVVQSHCVTTEYTVHSIGVFVREQQGGLSSGERTNSMYQSVRAIRSWYDIFFKLPPTDIIAMPFVFYIELSQTHVTLYRFTVSDDLAFDKAFLRQTADLLFLLEDCAVYFQRADTAYHFRTDANEDTLFGKGAKMLRGVKSNWEAILSHHLRGMQTPNSLPPILSPDENNAMMPTSNDPNLLTPVMIDVTSMLQETNWMTDALGHWE